MTDAESDCIGRAHWIKQNRAWRAPQSDSRDSEGRSGTHLPKSKKDPLDPKLYSYIFRRLVVDKRAPKEPIPLAQAIPVLVSGWKRTGLWPANYPSPTPTSTPTPTSVDGSKALPS
ncbi:hypothetical protein LPJ75_003171 [Coemansia sp. RSA 2598]|nr:hypothetical protein LPJ75_003171 [Coemansia sp. RSA 2598]